MDGEDVSGRVGGIGIGHCRYDGGAGGRTSADRASAGVPSGDPAVNPVDEKIIRTRRIEVRTAPSTPSAVYGGLIENAAVSYCPTRRLPDGVYARAVTIYTGAIRRPALDAAVQLAYPMAFATTSLLFIESQHTCEARLAPVWVESTSALGKVPFCFSVIRTHLYFSEEDVPV